MDKFVDYKEVPFGDEAGWNIEYKPVWNGEGNMVGWRPKAAVYAHGKWSEAVVANVDVNYKISVDEAGYVYIGDIRYNPFESLKPAEKRGLYDLYIENHMDIPDTISKDSPCYKQFIKEKERM